MFRKSAGLQHLAGFLFKLALMQTLNGKNVLLGITGSIAAYKAGEVIRELRKQGAEVRVVMTRGATEFVTPLTFQALSGHPVHGKLLDTESEAGMGHIELARWADCILVAPSSADFMARLVHGRANDLLGAVCLAGKVPLALAPAMNTQMWLDPATQDNAKLLQSRGVLQFGPDAGEQACGESGPGRMLEPVELVSDLADIFATGALSGKTVLVTAGPTREDIDPVRFISNRSSGKMGFSICRAAVEAGARVILISGPVALTTPAGVERIDVTSAAEMLEASQNTVGDADIFIATAAVADYRPVEVAEHKLKKDSETLELKLLRNPDILHTIKQQHPQLFCVGFAAETTNLDENARLKLHSKGVEMIAANPVGAAAKEAGGVFDSEVNALTLYWGEDKLELGLASKEKLARQLIQSLIQRYEHWLLHPGRGTGKIVTLRGN